MEPLSSRNPRVQQLRRLVRRRKARDAAGLFVLEGEGLLAEALAAGAVPHEVFVAEGAELAASTDSALGAIGVAPFVLDASVLESVASTANPQPVLSTVAMTDVGVDAAIEEHASFVVVGAGISEPGNAGTLIRTAAGAGADAIVFCEQPVDIYNPKVVRASAGALFRIPVVRDLPSTFLWQAIKDRSMVSVGLTGSATTTYDQLDLRAKIAVVFGNEAHGLSQATSGALDHLVSIPMASGLESVNVSAAAAAVCFEVSRQRRS